MKIKIAYRKMSNKSPRSKNKKKSYFRFYREAFIVKKEVFKKIGRWTKKRMFQTNRLSCSPSCNVRELQNDLTAFF